MSEANLKLPLTAPIGETFDVVWDWPEKANKSASQQDVSQKHKELLERLEQNKRSHAKPNKEKDTNTGKRTKEEILRLRKEMMEYKAPKPPSSNKGQDKPQVDFQGILNPGDRPATSADYRFKSKTEKEGLEPNSELLERLAYGKKSKVSCDKCTGDHSYASRWQKKKCMSSQTRNLRCFLKLRREKNKRRRDMSTSLVRRK